MEANSSEIIYNFVCENPGLNTYVIAKKLNMSGGKIRYFLSRLEKMGLVKFKFEKQSSRVQKLSYPISARDLLSRSMKSKLNKIKII